LVNIEGSALLPSFFLNLNLLIVKKIKLLMLLFSAISFHAFAQTEVLVWSDEFSVDGAPNSAYWGYDIGTNGGWGNNEVQNYTNNSSNVRVQSGALIIDALKSGGSWTSGRVKSQGKINFTYGRVKFNAKLPPGVGTWPALWMLGESITTKGWPACGEIDIMEHVGKNPGIVQSAMHTTSSSGNTINKGSKSVSTYNTAFHVYECNWTPDKIQFLVDGASYYTYQPSTKNSSTWPFTAPFFFIMNIAMGGNLGGPIDGALTSARMEIDYLRVYQSTSQITLQGPNVVSKNQTGITYKLPDLPGATFSWAVPADAVITAGDGTNTITVTWGQTEGSVTASITSEGNSFEKSVIVTHATKPTGSSFPLTSPDFNVMWAKNPENVNVFTIKSQSPLYVIYNVTSKASSPALIGTFSKGLDMSEHPVLRVSVKAYNKSKTLNLRMDLVDANGKSTTKTPVFNFTPIIDDGEYYRYTFNFQDENQWQSAIGSVSSTSITKVNLYIDYGVPAVLGIDSVWIDTLWVEKPVVSLDVPNRPSHLQASGNGTITFGWQDNAEDEEGFELYRSLTLNGPFVSVKELAANSMSTTLTSDGIDYYYQIKSFNATGHSDVSNTITPDDLVTGVERDSESLVKVYPNPTSGYVYVEQADYSDAHIQVFGLAGNEMLQYKTEKKLFKADLSSLAKGSYYLRVGRKGKVVVKKLVIQ
jgi:beta-glucanase (GH16 family)